MSMATPDQRSPKMESWEYMSPTLGGIYRVLFIKQGPSFYMLFYFVQGPAFNLTFARTLVGRQHGTRRIRINHEIGHALSEAMVGTAMDQNPQSWRSLGRSSAPDANANSGAKIPALM